MLTTTETTTETLEIGSNSSERSSGTVAESSETGSKSSETSDCSSETAKKSSERILDLIRQKPSISAAEIAMLIDMSSRGVEKQIKKLREEGVIRRKGADFGGYWEIVTDRG